MLRKKDGNNTIKKTGGKMNNEERILKVTRHLEECLAHLDLLIDEVDSSRIFMQNIISKAREKLSEQLDQLSKLGEIFSHE